MDLDVLTISSFWLETPSYKSTMYLPWLVVFGLFLIIGTILLVRVRNDWRALAVRYTKLLFTASVMGLIYLAARYERLPFLSARIVFGLILLVSFIWFIALLIWSGLNTPKLKKEQKIKEKYEKYLPKAKRNQVSSKQ